MRLHRWLLIAGLASFVIGLCLMLPARVAYRWVASPQLQLAGLDGTVWRGRAREASVNGIYLENVDWALRPLRLFQAALAYDLSGDPPSGFLESEVAIGLSGRVSIRDLSAALPLSAFSQQANIRGLEGNASLSFERIDIVDGAPVAADGVLRFADVIVPLLGRVPLGAYRAEFATQGEAIVASVEDTDGIVDVAGSLELGAGRQFELTGLIAPVQSTPEIIRRQIELLPTNDRGQREIRVSGTY